MTWLIMCGSILLVLACLGVGWHIVGDSESWYLALAVGAVVIAVFAVLIGGFLHGLGQVNR
jgi:hypothetical protein